MGHSVTRRLRESQRYNKSTINLPKSNLVSNNFD